MIFIKLSKHGKLYDKHKSFEFGDSNNPMFTYIKILFFITIYIVSDETQLNKILSGIYFDEMCFSKSLTSFKEETTLKYNATITSLIDENNKLQKEIISIRQSIEPLTNLVYSVRAVSKINLDKLDIL